MGIRIEWKVGRCRGVCEFDGFKRYAATSCADVNVHNERGHYDYTDLAPFNLQKFNIESFCMAGERILKIKLDSKKREGNVKFVEAQYLI